MLDNTKIEYLRSKIMTNDFAPIDLSDDFLDYVSRGLTKPEDSIENTTALSCLILLALADEQKRNNKGLEESELQKRLLIVRINLALEQLRRSGLIELSGLLIDYADREFTMKLTQKGTDYGKQIGRIKQILDHKL